MNFQEILLKVTIYHQCFSIIRQTILTEKNLDFLTVVALCIFQYYGSYLFS